MAVKTVRIAANANNKNWETVNVVTTPLAANQAKQHVQATAAQAANSPHQIETFQDSGGGKKGLRTIQIPGYVGPN